MNNKVLLENLRCIPDFPKKGINFRDVTTLYKNPECLKIMLDEMYELYKDKGITKVVGIESRGFIMGSALAAKLGAGMVMARKPGKLPFTVIKEQFSKEYGVDTIEMHIDSINENDVILIVVGDWPDKTAFLQVLCCNVGLRRHIDVVFQGGRRTSGSAPTCHCPADMNSCPL